jgi:TPR repeat protein
MELGVVLFWDHAAHGEGLTWIRRAAEQCHVGAQYFLAAELATGENVRKDVQEAARWYRRAARQAHSEAQYNLALMYWAGEGVPRSPTAAHRWLEKAAISGDLLALRALAEAYETGQLGYRRNRARARYWRSRYNRVNTAALKHAGARVPRKKP